MGQQNNLTRYREISKAGDVSAPLDHRLSLALEDMGLEAEHRQALSVAPGFVGLADEALMQVMSSTKGADGPGEGQGGESRRSKFERRRREELEARGQKSLDIDYVGTSTEDLVGLLSFSKYMIFGKMMTVSEILEDAERREQLVSSLKDEVVRYGNGLKAAELDLAIAMELTVRADASEQAVAAE